MLVAIENALAMIEQHSLSDERGPTGERVVKITKPEEDVTNVGKTLAIVNYQRIFMSQVFSTDAFHEKQMRTQASRKVRIGNIKTTLTRESKKWDQPRFQLGIDREKAIKIMSTSCEKKLGYTAAQLKRKCENEITLVMNRARQKRIREKARLKAEGVSVSSEEELTEFK